MTRAEVAAALDLHESTVSRAVAGKYVLLPDRDDRRAVAVLRGQRRHRRGAAEAAGVGRRPDVGPAPRRPAARGRLPDRPADRRQASRAPRIHRGAACAEPTPAWPGSCCVAERRTEHGRLRMFEPNRSRTPTTERFAVVLSDVHIGNGAPTCWYQSSVHERQLTEVLVVDPRAPRGHPRGRAARRPVRRLDLSAARAAAVDGRHHRRQPPRCSGRADRCPPSCGRFRAASACCSATTTAA